jgi:hypothetical protein
MSSNGMVRPCSCPPAHAIGAMSCGLVSISWSDGYLEVYSASTAALNMLMERLCRQTCRPRDVIIAEMGAHRP